MNYGFCWCCIVCRVLVRCTRLWKMIWLSCDNDTLTYSAWRLQFVQSGGHFYECVCVDGGGGVVVYADRMNELRNARAQVKPSIHRYNRRSFRFDQIEFASINLIGKKPMYLASDLFVTLIWYSETFSFGFTDRTKIEQYQVGKIQ